MKYVAAENKLRLANAAVLILWFDCFGLIFANFGAQRIEEPVFGSKKFIIKFGYNACCHWLKERAL